MTYTRLTRDLHRALVLLDELASELGQHVHERDVWRRRVDVTRVEASQREQDAFSANNSVALHVLEHTLCDFIMTTCGKTIA